MSGYVRRRIHAAYLAAKGEAALARQRELAKLLHVCCAEPVDGPHHPACAKFEQPVLPEVIPGQQQLG